MSEQVTADSTGGKSKYEVALPVRCDDCGEVSTKVETIILAEHLPDCPDCGAEHMGGQPPEQRLEGQSDVIEDMVEFADAAMSGGATPTQVFDYLFAVKLGIGVKEWSDVRDVGESAVERRVDAINELRNNGD